MKDPRNRNLGLFGWPFNEEENIWEMEVPAQTGLTVSEDEKNVYIEAHLPGLTKENIEVTFENGMLWIRGAKEEEEKDKQKKYYRKAASSFSYRVQVPGIIDEKKEPDASYSNGILKVTFSKLPQGSKAKKISVKSR